MAFQIEDGVLTAYIKEPDDAEVIIPEGVTGIGYRAFRDLFRSNQNPITVRIPDSVTDIGEGAFWGCTALTNVTIPEHITGIGEGAFYYCRSLREIHIPDSVTEIGAEAFAYCTSLTEVVLPDSIRSIENNTFYGCDSLSSVHIPDGVEWIGYRAFVECEQLAAVCIPDSVKYFGDICVFDARLQKAVCRGAVFEKQNGSLTSLDSILRMVIRQDYSAKIHPADKYDALWKLFAAAPDNVQLLTYIKRNFVRMFRVIIDRNDIPAAELVMQSGRFLSARNIDRLIDYAIEKKQPEMQLLLMNYKNEKIGYSKKSFRL